MTLTGDSALVDPGFKEPPENPMFLFQRWLAKADEIFQARPREAQAVAVISKQSAPLKNKAALRDQVRQLIQSGEKISRPKKWHAYYLAVDSIEFWHGSKDLFHQRLRYDLIDHVWHNQPLQP